MEKSTTAFFHSFQYHLTSSEALPASVLLCRVLEAVGTWAQCQLPDKATALSKEGTGMSAEGLLQPSSGLNSVGSAIVTPGIFITDEQCET